MTWLIILTLARKVLSQVCSHFVSLETATLILVHSLDLIVAGLVKRETAQAESMLCTRRILRLPLLTIQLLRVVRHGAKLDIDDARPCHSLCHVSHREEFFVEDFKDVSFELKDTFRLGVLFAVRMVILLRLKAVFALMVHVSHLYLLFRVAILEPLRQLALQRRHLVHTNTIHDEVNFVDTLTQSELICDRWDYIEERAQSGILTTLVVPI